MLIRVLNIIFFSVMVLLSAGMTVAWFIEFGARAVFPFIMAVITLLLMVVLYNVISEED